MKRNILFQIFSLQILTSSFAERIKVNSEFFFIIWIEIWRKRQEWALLWQEGMSCELYWLFEQRITSLSVQLFIDTNTTVGYPYNYHYCTYVQCGFFLLSCDISLLHTRHYISLKRVHTIELLLSGRILISNGYL